jgi:hypothetical protein
MPLFNVMYRVIGRSLVMSQNAKIENVSTSVVATETAVTTAAVEPTSEARSYLPACPAHMRVRTPEIEFIINALAGQFPHPDFPRSYLSRKSNAFIERSFTAAVISGYSVEPLKVMFRYERAMVRKYGFANLPADVLAKLM